MKSVLKNSLAAVALAAATVGPVAVPAQAQVAGIATSSPEAVLLQSQARIAAYNAINTANATQIQQINTLRGEITTLQQGMDTNGDRNLTQAEADAQPAVWQQYQAKEQQLDQLSLPIVLSQYYVIEQLLARYGEAQSQVIQSKKIQVMLTPEAFQYAADQVDVTKDILTALNTLVPSVATTPPAGYQPRRDTVEIHQTIQQLILVAAQQAAARQQQGQPAPAGEQPSGR
ncbi:OmpH family outer membrane protein [Parerythrobacter aurantius]|uniref:OmpH family outer membrane protein n=1 Tax=Parerythrobacter aurantius TaxID=3127706 RepID=UPI00325205F0